MFALAIRYLCGFASAAAGKREAPEWPPHPDRAFMALTGAYFETDSSTNERAALEWLEAIDPPLLSASLAFEEHAPVPVYVPVNGDRRNMESPIKVMPAERKRDRRFFPAVIPENDTVYFIWQSNLSAEHRSALERLCARVGYVGDTSSLVQMWVEDNPPAPTLIPTGPTHFTQRLRVPYAGRLKDLEADYRRDAEAGEYRQRVFRWGHYRVPETPEQPVSSTNFNLYILRREDGPTLGITDTLALTEALRGAVITVHPQQPPPEWVSGHALDGKRSQRDHLAFVALPNVDNEHADGTLKGVALAVPKAVPRADIDACLGGLFGWEEPKPATLTMGRLGVWRILPQDSLRALVALRPETWCGPSRRWATVTPIVLDHYPKQDSDWEEIVARACERIGLPRPQEVVLVPGSLFIGAPPAKQFPPLPRKFGKGQYLHVHALIIFAEEVRGPVLLGAGRYRGYGLCRPYRQGGAT